VFFIYEKGFKSIFPKNSTKLSVTYLTGMISYGFCAYPEISGFSLIKEDIVF